MPCLFQIPQAVGSQDPGALEEIRPGYGHSQGLDGSRYSGTVRGDCPLEDADGILASEQHLTVCHYLRCKSCGSLYYVGACIRGKPVFRRVTDQDTERIAFRLWGRCGTFFENK